MSRKTFSVKQMVEIVNEKTRQSYEGQIDAEMYGGKLLPYMTPEYRHSIQAICSEILSLTENYNGFTCLTTWEKYGEDSSLRVFYLPK